MEKLITEILEELKNIRTKGIVFVKNEEEKTVLSYAQIYEKAELTLSFLQSNNIKPGMEAIFQMDTEEDFIVMFWGCILGGIIPVPLNKAVNYEQNMQLIRVWNILEQPFFLGSETTLKRFHGFLEGKVDSEEFAEIKSKSVFYEHYKKDINISPVFYEPKADDLFALLFSSGSTGDPKAVMITHRNLMININSLCERWKIDGEKDCSLSWMPLTHVMGLVLSHFASNERHVQQVIMPPSLFVSKPELWLEKAEEYGATILSSPNFGMKLLNTEMEQKEDNAYNLSKVRIICNAAEPISIEVCNHFLDILERQQLKRNTIVPYFGMTEATISITAAEVGERLRFFSIDRRKLEVGEKIFPVEYNNKHAITFVDLGSPFSCCKVRIIGSDKQVLEEERIGYVQVKGNSVTQGYYKNPEATKAALSPDGWLTTGDLGFLSHNRLVVTGRVKDIIFVNGQNFYPHDIEKIAENAEGVKGRKIVVAALRQDLKNEEVGVFVEFDGKLEDFIPIIKSIKEEINEKMGLDIYDVVPIEAIPKTASGKIKRHQLSRRYNAGSFASVLHKIQTILINGVTSKSPTKSEEREIEKRIREIFESVLNTNEIDLGVNIFRYGINSLSMMKIVDLLQREFRVSIEINDLFEYKTIQELAKQVEKQKGIREEQRYSLREADIEYKYEPFPLTEIQMAYLLGRNENYDLGGISTHVYIEIKTRLEIERLNRALGKVIKKHPMMRAVFENDKQRILKETPEYKIEVLDLSHLNCEAVQMEVLNERNKMSHSIFQAEQWPLFEIKAIKDVDGLHYLLIGLDMLIIDALSLEIIAKDLTEFYENEELEAEEAEFSFRDYMMAYQDLKASVIYEKDKAYWQEKLDHFPQAPNLPLKADVSTVKNLRFERIQQFISRETRRKLKHLAMDHNVTESAILCTAYLEILSVWSNQPKLAINLTVINRYPFHNDVDKLVGDFTSVLPLAVDFEHRSDFWDKVEVVQKTMMEGIKHRHYDGVEFVRELSKSGRNQGAAMIPIVFTSALTNEMWGKWNQLGEIQYIITQTSQVYLDYQASEVDGQLLLNWDYVVDFFEEHIIQHMFEQYVQFISSLCEKGVVSQFTLYPEDKEVILKYNDTFEKIEPFLLHALFEEQVYLKPDNIAIIDGERTITYAQLNKKANQIARKLRRDDFGGNGVIGVFAARCMESIANIIGILKAGRAYVPIDPSYPQNRVDYILESSGCGQIIKPDYCTSGPLEPDSDQNLNIEVKPQEIAYIIYTSGSTGIPKGVVITHEAASNTVIDINQKFHVGEADRVLGISSMCFDLSVYDIFGTFASGATLVIIPDQRDVNYMNEMIQKHKVTIWNSVPAIMDMMVQHIMEDMNHSKEMEISEQKTAVSYPEIVVKDDFQVKYYWSPAISLTQEELAVYEKVKPEGLALFPEFYLYMKKGASYEQISEKYKDVSKEKLKTFLACLVKDKVLVNSINNPYEIFSTQELLFENQYPEEIRYNPDLYEKYKEKQLNRNYEFASGEVIALMAPEKYSAYLENRCSHRRFDESKEISFSCFSYLLSVFKQRIKQNKIQYYYSSAGGLYPIDLYLYVKKDRVEGVKEGIYYYNPASNSIALIDDNIKITDEIQFYSNKSIFRSSAFTIYFVYNAEATMPKYGGSGYLYACIDTGIMVGTLTGVAEELNVGTCSIGEIDMESMEEWFHWNKNQKLLHSLEVGGKEQAFVSVEKKKQILLGDSVCKDRAEENSLCSLRVIMLSGDWIPLNLPDKIKKLCKNAKVISLGGATEASIWSIYYPIEKQEHAWKSIPYGIPLANQQIYILNYRGELCHINTPGEIYIGGVGVAQGYRNDEEKTGKAFILHPEFGRLYRTGDYGVMTSHGYVEFLGRKDEQVKIRGYRIELGEIEHQLNSHEKILSAAVIDFDDKDGKKYLCAYVVSNEKIDFGELKEYLRTKLPEYMIPSYILSIDSIPWSSNGKVNKKVLPRPETMEIQKELIRPKNEIEEIIMGFWKEVLHTDEISTMDNFFDIGGDSMLLLKVYSKIDHHFPKVMKIADLFTRTTIWKIATFLNQKIKPEEKIQVRSIKLNREYFRESGMKSANPVLSFSMDHEVEEMLKQIARKENLSTGQLLTAFYIYTFHQISGQECVELQVLSENQNQITVLRIDFNGLKTFEELFLKMKNGSAQSRYLIKDLKTIDIKRENNGIIPLFMMKQALTETVNLSDYYDFIITADFQDGKLCFVCEYGSSELKTDKVKEMVTDYLNLLNMFLEQYGREEME
ncbi:MAG: AMP-binding protein [Hungatella sp.]|jgi:SagB-type dehydrogenase family enzyme|nr:AMP-binding protein [Hungatella sp.]